MKSEHADYSGVAGRHERDLAASYHALLRSSPELTRRSHQRLADGHTRHGLMVAGRQLCYVLRPRFMREARRERLAYVSEVLAALLERAGTTLLASDTLLDLVGASAAEREIWAVDPGYDCMTVTSRLDAFMVEDHPRFVEYNAESPAGIGFSDALSSLFIDLPVMRGWEVTEWVHPFECREALTQSLLWAYRQWGGMAAPTIAIIDWDDVITRRDFELCAEHLRARGLTVHITDPRRFSYRGGALWLGEERITLVYRRVLLHELLDRAAECGDLLDAYREGAICMVNSPRSKLLHKKTVFALLSDDGLGLSLSPEERAVVGETIPWTRILRTGRTSFHGQEVDLPTLIQRDRQRFTIKPADDYGGRGVVLGWDVSDEAWARAIERGLREPHVVQERVDVPRAEFPLCADGTLELVTMSVDTDPLLFRGKMGGIVTRIAGGALLNVTAGAGSAIPAFVY